MTNTEVQNLIGRVINKNGTGYTVTSASTFGEVCVWDSSTQTLMRFDSRETFENWAYGKPVSSTSEQLS
jgi:hypothetical protein